MLERDSILNERYRLIEPIGEGGMATVYRALDTRLGREVAIKVLHPEYARDQPFVQRFQQEAEFAASLGAHPNIVAIYDVGEDGNIRYIVMELVRGSNLKQIIRQRAPIAVPEAFAIAQRVALALDFAHKRGLVHRDVKPQNILVTEDGVAKVTDFGIARGLSASQLTRTGMVIGTAHYFSPEQAQGKPAGPESDIYALGIILYEMLTGHLPFDADNAIGVAMQHLHSEPPSPWDFNPSLPARAVGTMMRALEKDPARRYRDAAEFAAALGAGMASTAGTTTMSPIVEPPREATRMIPVVEQRPVRRVIEPPVGVAASSENVVATTTSWRPLALAAGILILVAGAAAGAFFLTGNVLGGAASATSTPTVTPTRTPVVKKRHHATPKPTTAPVVVRPTNTSVLPTFTATPKPAPTSTPKPKPTPKPTRKPVPTNTVSVPTATVTVKQTPTVSVGPTPTGSPIG